MVILLGLFLFVVHGEGGDERMSKTNAHKLKCTRTLSLFLSRLCVSVSSRERCPYTGGGRWLIVELA
jgi:hypothetical protein